MVFPFAKATSPLLYRSNGLTRGRGNIIRNSNRLCDYSGQGSLSCFWLDLKGRDTAPLRENDVDADTQTPRGSDILLKWLSRVWAFCYRKVEEVGEG